jgi:hypothetical protein
MRAAAVTASLLVLAALAACDGGGSADAAPDGPQAFAVRVTWTPLGGCQPGVSSDVLFAVEVTDGGERVPGIGIAGQVAGCAPARFSASRATLSCPHVGSYQGSVAVTDPVGGRSETVTFVVTPCSAGSMP